MATTTTSLSSPACSRCGTTEGHVAFSAIAGAPLCGRCYCRLPDARYRPPGGPVARLKPPPAPTLPEWQELRRTVVDGMVRDGSFFYLDRDHCAGRCPVCDAVMSVHFIGRTPIVELDCDDGCDPADIGRALGQRQRPTADLEV